MSMLKSAPGWLRQTVGWSNSQAAWQERFILLGFLLVGIPLVWFSWFNPKLGVWPALIAWASYGLALALCSRQGWIKLFGPVLFYDMLRSARRNRFVIMRLLYAFLLLFLLCFLYLTVIVDRRRHDPDMVVWYLLGFLLFFLAQVVLVILFLLLPWRTSRIILGSLIAILVVAFTVAIMFIDLQGNGGGPITHRETALLAELFFGVFMLVQIALVVLLTPAFVAGAIADEKDRKTLEFLLATDLHNREIVLSKLLSRLANVALFLLTGLPILSILQFIGGVDPQLMLAGFAGTGLTMLGVASLSILLSTLLKKPRDAIGVTYLILLAFIAVGSVAFGMETARHPWMHLTLYPDDAPSPIVADLLKVPKIILAVAGISILLCTLFEKLRAVIGVAYLVSLALIIFAAVGVIALATEVIQPVWTQLTLWPEGEPPTLATLSRIFNAGNPLTACTEVTMAINGFARSGGRTTLAAELPSILQRYAWCHVPLALVCITWSIIRLRTIALRQTPAGKTAKLGWWDARRPKVGELPMLWKEFHIEGGTKQNWLAWIAAGVLVLLTVGSGLCVLGVFLWEVHYGRFGPGPHLWSMLSERMNFWFRFAGTGVSCLMLLHMGVRASTSISSERERDTFDALITTPMSSEAILGAKVLGTLTSMRFAWVWFGTLLCMGLFTGGVHVFAVPIVITAWFVYALFFTMVGTWFSMVCKSSSRATVYTVLTTLFLGGGHWIVMGMCCFFPMAALLRMDRPGEFPQYLMFFELGMTPPFVLGLCAYCQDDLAINFHHREFTELWIFSLIGLFLWALGCIILWFGILVPKFQQLTRREEMLYQ